MRKRDTLKRIMAIMVSAIAVVYALKLIADYRQGYPVTEADAGLVLFMGIFSVFLFLAQHKFWS